MRETREAVKVREERRSVKKIGSSASSVANVFSVVYLGHTR